MTMRFAAIVLALLAGLLALAAHAEDAPRRTLELREGWSFHLGNPASPPQEPGFDDSGWQRVALPHSWNRIGEYALTRSAATSNVQGVGWYRLRFAAPAMRRGERAVLQFDGVGTVAEVWLNGQPVGQHRGAYSAFRFDVTDLLAASGDNTLAVRADNSKPAPGSPTADVLPISGDFFPYGGLYRGVSLIVAPPLQIDLLDHGGPGVYATTVSADMKVAEVEVLTRIRNLGRRHGAARIVATIADEQGSGASAEAPVARLGPRATGEVRQRLTLRDPRLWDGRRDPHLYTLTVELRAGARVLDRVTQPLGIRTFRLDPDRGFILNGQPLALHGVSRHQDRQGKGAALTDADHEQDMALIEELGANTIRFAHYQHATKWFDLADRRGMIVWAEIPYVSMASFNDAPPSPALVANAHQQLIELIRQNFNRPSVVVWGVGNEVDSKVLFTGKPARALDLVQSLHALARKEDPGRPTALADCCAESPLGNPAAAEVLVGATDAVGFNRYPGWYGPDAAAMGPILDRLRRRFPGVPMSVSEYGAGGALSQHTDNPLGGAINAFGRPHPEGYQAWVHEENWRALKARPWLWATWVWNMFDFASDFRAEGDAIDLNDKGLITFDRATRKDAFYFYKANWSAEPVLHIAGRRYVERSYPAADLTVYSNAEAARLEVNGADLGTRSCADGICRWRDVALAPGANRIVARAAIGGKEQADAIVLTGPDPERDGIRINAGYLTRTILEDGRRFGSDHFFEGGTARALNPRDITALFERRGARDKAVAGAREPILHDGYREGRFTYSVPLPDGRWRVTVTSFEPDHGASGARAFAIRANGRTAVARFDPFAEAGGALREVSRQFPVTVTGGRLKLEFEPLSGAAIVSAIEIVR